MIWLGAVLDGFKGLDLLYRVCQARQLSFDWGARQPVQQTKRHGINSIVNRKSVIVKQEREWICFKGPTSNSFLQTPLVENLVHVGAIERLWFVNVDFVAVEKVEWHINKYST